MLAISPNYFSVFLFGRASRIVVFANVDTLVGVAQLLFQSMELSSLWFATINFIVTYASRCAFWIKRVLHGPRPGY